VPSSGKWRKYIVKWESGNCSLYPERENSNSSIHIPVRIKRAIIQKRPLLSGRNRKDIRMPVRGIITRGFSIILTADKKNTTNR
jgi:hypothetical protein